MISGLHVWHRDKLLAREDWKEHGADSHRLLLPGLGDRQPWIEKKSVKNVY